MDKTLKKLNRMELLELLVKASETNEALVAENDQLRHDMAQRQSAPQRQPQAQSQARFPQAAKVGSIAEAALRANGYFDAAQRAADDYLREIKLLRDRLAARANAAQAQDRARQSQQGTAPQQVNAEAYIKDAQMRANAILNQANQQANAMLKQANAQAEATVGRANQQANAIVADARSKSEAIVADANKKSHSIIAQANNRVDSLLQATGSDSDKRSTGPLLRRGRHVKASEGAVA